MRTFPKALAAVAMLAGGVVGCSDTTTSSAAPTASKVTESKSKAGRETPSGVGTMPKEPGR